jgi:hypothetical protein
MINDNEVDEDKMTMVVITDDEDDEEWGRRMAGEVVLPPPSKVMHGYTSGINFIDHTQTCSYCVCHGHG